MMLSVFDKLSEQKEILKKEYERHSINATKDTENAEAHKWYAEGILYAYTQIFGDMTMKNKNTVEDPKLETHCFYYMCEAVSETEDIYTYYYRNESAALKAFDLCESEKKTYGKAHFVDGKLEPFEVLGTTL